MCVKNNQCAKKCTLVILLWYHKDRIILFLLGDTICLEQVQKRC